MRSLLLLCSISFFAASAYGANNNPWMRVCRIDQGQFLVIQSESAQHALCFLGDRAVGAEALFLFKANLSNPLSILTYKNRNMSYARGGVCGAFGANLIEGVDSTRGTRVNICHFSDDSLIEEATLWLGPGTTGSQLLDKAVSETYSE